MVWVSSAEAEFVKGKYLWVHWDVDELKALIKQKSTERPFLTLGVNGMPNIVR
jgi:hypothetical protein